MKCHIYLQDDMMNHVLATINHLVKVDKWFRYVIHVQIQVEEI